MTKNNADRAVLMSMIVTAGSTVAASAMPEQYGGKGELPHPRLLIATGMAFFILSILGNASPEVGGNLAIVLGATAVTYYGFPVMANFFDEKNRMRRVGNELQMAQVPGFSMTPPPFKGR